MILTKESHQKHPHRADCGRYPSWEWKERMIELPRCCCVSGHSSQPQQHTQCCKVQEDFTRVTVPAMRRWFGLLLVCCLDAQLIPGYPRVTTLLGGRMTIGWELVGSSVRMAFEVGDTYQWAALGFQKGKMAGDAIILEHNKIAPYNVVYQQTPTEITAAYYTNASFVKENGVIRGYFTRTLAAPSPSTMAINPDGMNFMTAVSTGGFPSAHGTNERASNEYLNLRATDAPTPQVMPTPFVAATTAPTAPTLPTTLSGYTTYIDALDKNMRIGWTVNDTHVKFGFEARYASWVGLGVQDPTASTRMTGQAVIVQVPSTVAAYTLQYTVVPSVYTGSYMTGAVGGKTGDLIHGEFVRTLAAPSVGTVAISDVHNVKLMVAYGANGFPATHIGRAEISVDLTAPSPTPVPQQTASASLVWPSLLSLSFLSLWLA